MPTRLPMVPLGRNSAAALPRRAAAISSSRLTMGSSPNTSSPSGAVAMAWRISGLGVVTVSERRSVTTRIIQPGLKTKLIFAGGRIRTLGRSGLRSFSHLAIGGGRVIACGGAGAVGLRWPCTGGGGPGAPGLPGVNDAHAHVVYYGLTRFGAGLGGTRSVADVAQRLKAHARSLKPGEWQLGMGYRADELTERRPPHRTELDRVAGRRPAVIDDD